MVRNILFVLSGLILLLLPAGCGGGGSDGAPAPPAGSLSISGTVTAAAGSAIDSDTNDPSAPYVNNDLSQNAQSLSNPTTLGGFVTEAATGVAGDRFASTPDPQDWYRVTLVAGQTITLTIADHDSNGSNFNNPDLDLYLVDTNTLIDLQSSEGFQRQETIQVLNDGSYYLQVTAYSGHSNYVLSIGLSTLSSPSQALRIEDAFVADEIIVRFDPSKRSAAAAQSLSATGLSLVSGNPAGLGLYRLTTTSTSARLSADSTLSAKRKGVFSQQQQAKRATLDQVKKLRRRADVISTGLNYVRRAFLIPNDPYFANQWNSTQINLPQAWEFSTGSAETVVATLDGGVLMNHPDLVSRLCTSNEDCRGYDLVASATSAADGDGIDPDPTDPGDKSLPDGSSSFHGTHVAGIVGAAGDNLIGVSGATWGSRIMPVRVLGVSTGTSYDVMQGMRYAAGLSNDSGTVPLQPADVINLSLGGSGFSQVEQDLVTSLNNQGIIIVAASGNEASNLPNYPAAYSGVLAVSAVDIDKQLAPYSNYGSYISLAAPGGNLATDRNGDGIADGVISTAGDDRNPTLRYTYVPYMGTSMAAPQVSGVIALMKTVDPALIPAEFEAMLAAGLLTEDLGQDGPAVANDQYGYGLIDAQKSVLAALDLAGGGTLPPSLAASPSLLDFGSSSTSLPVTLVNAGEGTLNLTGVSYTASWISSVTLVNETPPGSGLGQYLVSVDRSALTDSIYSATITFSSDSAGSLPLRVLLQVGSPGIPNAGLQRILLISHPGGSILQSVTASADPESGTYPFSFSNLPAGSYLVRSSSDSDHDGQICDPGEACGTYPLLTDPTLIDLTTVDRNHIDFSCGFDISQ